MRTHWKKILLLILLAVLASRGFAANVAVWPDAGGGGGSGTASAIHGELGVATAFNMTFGAIDTYQAIDGAGNDYAFDGDATPCFEEVADGQLRYICAGSANVEFLGTFGHWGSGIALGSLITFRIAKSTDGGSSWGTVGGLTNTQASWVTADNETAPGGLITSALTVSNGQRFRLEAQANATGQITIQYAKLRAIAFGSGPAGADADFATDGATNENVLAGRALVSTEASSTTLTTLDMSGSVITNTGAAGSVTYTLGTATCSAGMQFTVLNAEDGQPIVLDPYSTVDQIINLTDAAGDSVTSDGVGTSAISCQCIAAGDWFCTRSGSWTDTN